MTDQDIRIVSREAFPDFASFFSALPAAGMMPGVQKLVDQSAKASAAAAPPTAAAPARRQACRWTWWTRNQGQPARPRARQMS